MLSLEVPARQVGGVLVFADHADPNQFYYAAPNPTVAKTAGRSMFDVFSYAVELKSSPLAGTTIPQELGAGFLTMGVECVLSPATRAQAVNELAGQLDLDSTKLNLAPIPYTRGTVSVIALDASSGTVTTGGAGGPETPGRPTFVRQIVGSSTPSLLGDLRSIFSLSLSQEGVVFLQGLYGQGAAPVGVIYDLKFLGLRPAVQARIHADVSRIYSEFSAKASVGYPVYFRAEVEDTISKLRQQGHITIDITTQAVGEEATKATELALSLFKDKIIQELFQPTPTPQIPNLGALAGGLNAFATQPQSIVSLSLKMKSEEELRTIDFDFTQRAPEERTHAPQGFISTLLSAAEVKDRIHHVDLASPFFELLEVLVTGPSDEEFEALSLRSVTADLTYGKPGGPAAPDTESLLFRPGATGDRTWAVKRNGRPSLAYTVDLVYEFSRDGGVDGDSLTYRTGPREHTGRTLSIRPYDDVAVLDVEVERGRMPGDVRDVDVVLDYRSDEFAAHHQVRLPKDTVPPIDQRRWQVRTKLPSSATPGRPTAGGTPTLQYTATPTLTFDDGAVLALPPVTSTERLLRVDAPFTATRQLLVQPAVTAQDVTAITVEVAYEDDKAGYTRSFVRTFTPGSTDAAGNPVPGWKPETLTWPIMDGSRQKLRYRVTTAAGGVVDATDWLTTDEPSIVVGDTGARQRKVEVRLIGPALAEAGLDAVNVRVGVAGSTDDEAQSVFFDPSTPVAQTVSLPSTPGAPPGFRYQTTGFHTDGRQTQSAWLDAPNPLLVISTRSV